MPSDPVEGAVERLLKIRHGDGLSAVDVRALRTVLQALTEAREDAQNDYKALWEAAERKVEELQREARVLLKALREIEVTIAPGQRDHDPHYTFEDIRELIAEARQEVGRE